MADGGPTLVPPSPPSPLAVLRRLDTGPRGLTEAEARARLGRFGENAVPERRGGSWARLFARSLKDPFTAVLLCLGLVSAAVFAWGTASVILFLVAVSCALRACGEYRADRSTAALRELVAATATVLRRENADAPPVARELPVSELVPGDVIRLAPGDVVPADVHILRATGLTVGQATLTGESAPVPKSAQALLGVGADVESAQALSGVVADAESATLVPGGRRPARLVGSDDGRPARLVASDDGQPAHLVGSDDGRPTHPAASDGHPPSRLVASDGHAPTRPAAPAAPEPTPLAAPHLCFQTTAVATGSATAVVTDTGPRTRFARAHAGSARPDRGSFDRSVHGVSWILVRFTLLTPPLVLMAGAALRGRGLETLPFAVAVAVGLTPEMLPVLVTTCLARGATLLARGHGVIVRRLPALHDLGAMDVLCVDKTGTLTRDRPVVDRALDADGHDDPHVLRRAAAAAWWSLQLAELPAPDALDEALLAAADEDAPTSYDGVGAVPFDPARRLATVLVRTPGRPGTHTLITKGAVEVVLERCDLTDEARARLLTLADRHAAGGLRVLAVAGAERPARTRPPTAADERGLTFHGLVTFRDELAPTAAAALAGLADRGVTVKVLTGDHPGTATRACHDLGVPLAPTEDADGIDAPDTPAASGPVLKADAVDEPGAVVGSGAARTADGIDAPDTPVASGPVLTADRIDGLTDPELLEAVRRTAVFARCTPEHKARVVRALRDAGYTVGFLGDGVNDLPALRSADVGIAPRGAADVVREAADVVLAEKDLTAVGHALTEGRHAGGNIVAYLRVTLSSNLGNVIAMLSAGLLLPFLPMLPAQVLVQNLCFDAAQLAFAYGRPAPASVRRPRVLDPRELLRFIVGFGALNAVADLATFGVLAYALRGPDDTEAVFHSGWFTENLLTQALVMALLRFAGTGVRRRPGPVTLAALALAAVGLALPPSPLGAALGLTPLPTGYYPLLAAVLVLYAVALRAARTYAGRRGFTP